MKKFNLMLGMVLFSVLMISLVSAGWFTGNVVRAKSGSFIGSSKVQSINSVAKTVTLDEGKIIKDNQYMTDPNTGNIFQIKIGKNLWGKANIKATTIGPATPPDTNCDGTVYTLFTDQDTTIAESGDVLSVDHSSTLNNISLIMNGWLEGPFQLYDSFQLTNGANAEIIDSDYVSSVVPSQSETPYNIYRVELCVGNAVIGPQTITVSGRGNSTNQTNATNCYKEGLLQLRDFLNDLMTQCAIDDGSIVPLKYTSVTEVVAGAQAKKDCEALGGDYSTSEGGITTCGCHGPCCDCSYAGTGCDHC